MKLEDFIHNKDFCSGKPELIIRENIPINLLGLGVFIVPQAPFVGCRKCESAFFYGGFDHEVEDCYAKFLLKEPRIFAPQEARFLRIVAGLNQKEMADWMMITKELYSHHEAMKDDYGFFGVQEQVVFRSVIASKLGVREPARGALLKKVPKNLGKPNLPKEVLSFIAQFIEKSKRQSFRLHLIKGGKD